MDSAVHGGAAVAELVAQTRKQRWPREASHVQDVKRFWGKVCKGCDSPNHDHSKGCWLWTGEPVHGGYGRFHVQKKGCMYSYPAHRFSFYLQTGAWSKNWCLHKCN